MDVVQYGSVRQRYQTLDGAKVNVMLESKCATREEEMLALQSNSQTGINQSIKAPPNW